MNNQNELNKTVWESKFKRFVTRDKSEAIKDVEPNLNPLFKSILDSYKLRPVEASNDTNARS